MLTHGIAARIRARRLQLGKTQAELAAAIGKSHGYWNHIELCKVSVNPDMCLVAAVLQCTAFDLIAGETPGLCELCGCTETTPCVLSRGRGRWLACSWTDDKETRCSFCVHDETKEHIGRWELAAAKPDIVLDESQLSEVQ